MAGGLFARLKNWIYQEDVDYGDLNGEFNNIIANLNPSGISGYEATVPQMQIQTDPGSIGSENLGTSIANDEAHLRFVIARLLGTTYWYQAPAASLYSLSSLINLGGSVPLNRIVSGRVGASNQPLFLQPVASAATVALLGGTTSLVYYINGAQYTLSTTATSPALGIAPVVNNTAVLDANVTAFSTTIPMNTVGIEITALVGKLAAFKLGSEYFIAYVKDASTLIGAIRGSGFTSSDTNIPSAAAAAGAAITLMRINWIYLDNTGSIQTSLTNPTYSTATPSSPSTGDYWFDFSVGNWKSYNGASWIISNSFLVGIAVVDGTTAVAMSGPFYRTFSSLSKARVYVYSNTEVRTSDDGFEVSSYGNYYGGPLARMSWPSTAIDTGSIAASKTYYLYVKDTGATIYSLLKPIDRFFDLRGMYHPSFPWRCIGEATTDGSSHFSTATSYVEFQDGTITRRQLAGDGIAFSTLPTVLQNIVGVTPTDVTNLTASITTTGKPIRIKLNPIQSAASWVRALNTADAAGVEFGGYVKIVEATLYPAGLDIPFSATKITAAATNQSLLLPSCLFEHVIQTAAAGTYSFKIQAYAFQANTTIQFQAGTQLIVQEIA